MNIVLINTFHNKAQIFKRIRKDINFQLRKNPDYKIEITAAQYKFYLKSLCGDKNCDCDKTHGDDYFYLLKENERCFIGFKKNLKGYAPDVCDERFKFFNLVKKMEGNKNDH